MGEYKGSRKESLMGGKIFFIIGCIKASFCPRVSLTYVMLTTYLWLIRPKYHRECHNEAEH